MKNKTLITVLCIILISGIFIFFNTQSQKDSNTVKVGHLGNLTASSLHIAQAKGFFKEEGLEVEIVKLSSTNELYDALVRGDIDFAALSGTMQVLMNEPKVGGVVKIAGLASLMPGVTSDKLITFDEKITTLKDLEGKKIGVFPGTTPTTFLKLFLKKNGVNTNTVTFIQIPAQSQLSALEAGSIDALFGLEPVPVIAELKNPKVKVLAPDIFAHVYPGALTGGRLATEDFMCTRADDFEKMQRAINKAQSVIIDNREEYISIISRDMNIPVEVLKRIAPPPVQPVDKNKFADFQDFLIRNGELKERANLDTILGCI